MLLFTMAFVSQAQSPQEDSQALLAVVDRTALPLPGLKADELHYLVGRLYPWAEQRLGSRVTVMTEENTFTLLQDMGINPADCVQQDCEVAIGRKIGADWLIVTKLYRFDDKAPFIFELRLYQTATSVFLGSQEARALTVIDLADQANAAAEKIFTRLIDKLGGVRHVETAQLTFILEPGPVFVQRDNQAIGTLTVPASGRLRLDTSPGSHDFVFSREGKLDWSRKLDAMTGAPQEISVSFLQGNPAAIPSGSGSGVLRVASQPGGATIHLDDVEIGTTTLQLADITIGMHRLRLSKPLYQTIERNVLISEDAVTEVSESLAPDFAPLTVRSDPPDAVVLLDGQERGRTPWSVERFPTGQYSLRLRADLYHQEERVLRVEPGVPLQIDARLRPAFGSLMVESHPDGAEVFVDEVSWGRAPAQRDKVRSGRHAVRVRLELFNDYESWVDVADEGRHIVTADLSANYGTLSLSGSPVGARVLVDGTSSGTLPIELRLRPGSHRLRVERDQYNPFDETIVLAVGDRRERQINLVRQTGALFIMVSPPEARIYLDGRRLGESPQILKELPTGRYQVRASLASYADHAEIIDLTVGSQTRLEITLSHEAWLEYAARRRKATYAAVLFPGGGQLISGQKRGAIYSLAAGAGAWLSVLSSQKYETALKDLHRAELQYRNSIDPLEHARHYQEMLDARDEQRQSRRLYWAGMATAGTSWLVGVVDARLFGGTARETDIHKVENRRGTFWHPRLVLTSNVPGVAILWSWH
ncbi:MAG: PEGA domain-containing protein [bacterium]|nr:PEGA domain-containing protein [bacterium]